MPRGSFPWGWCRRLRAEMPLPFLTRILQGGSSHAAAFAARGGPAWSVCLAGSFAALQLSS